MRFLLNLKNKNFFLRVVVYIDKKYSMKSVHQIQLLKRIFKILCELYKKRYILY